MARAEAQYCLGLIWSPEGEQVLLIQKRRPEAQAGLWNGIGGRVETLETPIQAMVRECREETGLSLPEAQWEKIGSFGDPTFKVHCFTAIADLALAKTATDETVRAHEWSAVQAGSVPLVRPIDTALVHARRRWVQRKRWPEEAVVVIPVTVAAPVARAKPTR